MAGEKLSLFSQHVKRWRGCTKCPLHAGRQRVVLARGTVPCDVLFVGEAPGESEDVVGQPFVGPAGELQQAIIDRALDGFVCCSNCGRPRWSEDGCPVCNDLEASPRPITYALTNLVCCIPRTEDNKKAGQPPDEAITACSDRLIEFGAIARPRLVVCVGKLSGEWLEDGVQGAVKLCPGVPRVHVEHPASILRASIASRGLLAQRSEVTIRTAVEDL